MWPQGSLGRSKHRDLIQIHNLSFKEMQIVVYKIESFLFNLRCVNDEQPTDCISIKSQTCKIQLVHTNKIYLTCDVWPVNKTIHIDGLVQDCSIASALTMEIMQSCTKPSIYPLRNSYTKNKLWSYSVKNVYKVAICTSIKYNTE